MLEERRNGGEGHCRLRVREKNQGRKHSGNHRRAAARANKKQRIYILSEARQLHENTATETNSRGEREPGR